MRFFNTEGPVHCNQHYCLPPLARWDLDELLVLIERQKYFLLHAPRQTGKTSCLIALMEHLNRVGPYQALYVNIETAQTAREDVPRAMRAICATTASTPAPSRRPSPAAVPSTSRPNRCGWGTSPLSIPQYALGATRCWRSFRPPATVSVRALNSIATRLKR